MYTLLGSGWEGKGQAMPQAVGAKHCPCTAVRTPGQQAAAQVVPLTSYAIPNFEGSQSAALHSSEPQNKTHTQTNTTMQANNTQCRFHQGQSSGSGLRWHHHFSTDRTMLLVRVARFAARTAASRSAPKRLPGKGGGDDCGDRGGREKHEELGAGAQPWP